MAILNGIKLSGSDEAHQLDYEKGIGNKPQIVTSYNDLKDLPTLVESFNDLKDKPFYTEGGQYILFEEQEVEFVAMSDGGMQGNGYIQSPSIDINGSLDCSIRWDGILYSCTPVVDSDTEESKEIYVGNLGFLGGEDTGEPFLIVDSLDMTVFASPTDGMHTVYISQSDEVVHQLDAKYVNAFTKQEMGIILGLYVDEVNTLLGGED